VEVAIDGGAYVTAAGTNTWSLDVGALTAGPHTVFVRGYDLAGNVTYPAKSNNFFYGVLSPFAIVTNDPGTCLIVAKANSLGTPIDGTNLVVGKSYQITVTPLAGYLYSNTVLSSVVGDTVDTSTKVIFTMQSNLTLYVNCPSNRFQAAAGTYYGLFRDETNGTDIKTAGYFSMKVTTKPSKLPTFSIKASVDGESVSGSGTFTLAGTGTLKKMILRKKSLQDPLNCTVSLDLDAQKVFGTMTTSNNLWYAAMEGNQAVWNLSNLATNYDGLYTMIVPGAVGSTAAPGGDGYGVLKITDTNGIINLSGALGDGSSFKQKVGMSKDGDWPLFVMTKKNDLKIFTGMVWGWVTVSPKTIASDLSGSLDWFQQPLAATIYPSGFTNMAVAIDAAPYTVPGDGELVIDLLASGTNGIGQITVANEAFLTNSIVVTNITFNPMPGLKVLTPANPDSLKVGKPAYKTGAVSGSFKHHVGQVGTPFKGAVLQDQNIARGFFKSLTESGSFLLEAQQ